MKITHANLIDMINELLFVTQRKVQNHKPTMILKSLCIILHTLKVLQDRIKIRIVLAKLLK